MRTLSLKKLAFRMGMMMILLLMLIAESGVTRAADSLTISLAINLYPVIGDTPASISPLVIHCPIPSA